MKAIYKFHWDCGRNGDLRGLFIAKQADVQNLIGKEVYFGEVLGKHSEVCGTLEEKELTVISTDQEFIAQCEAVFGEGTISGYNPLHYYDPDEQDEQDDDDE